MLLCGSTTIHSLPVLSRNTLILHMLNLLTNWHMSSLSECNSFVNQGLDVFSKSSLNIVHRLLETMAWGEPETNSCIWKRLLVNNGILGIKTIASIIIMTALLNVDLWFAERIPSPEEETSLKLEEVDLEQDSSELDDFLNEPAWDLCGSPSKVLLTSFHTHPLKLLCQDQRLPLW